MEVIANMKSGKEDSKHNLIRRYGMNTYFTKCIVTVHRRRWEKIDCTEMLMKITCPFSVCIKQREQFLIWYCFLVLPISAVAIFSFFSFKLHQASTMYTYIVCSTVVLWSMSLCTFLQPSKVLKCCKHTKYFTDFNYSCFLFQDCFLLPK